MAESEWLTALVTDSSFQVDAQRICRLGLKHAVYDGTISVQALLQENGWSPRQVLLVGAPAPDGLAAAVLPAPAQPLAGAGSSDVTTLVLQAVCSLNAQRAQQQHQQQQQPQQHQQHQQQSLPPLLVVGYVMKPSRERQLAAGGLLSAAPVGASDGPAAEGEHTNNPTTLHSSTPDHLPGHTATAGYTSSTGSASNSGNAGGGGGSSGSSGIGSCSGSSAAYVSSRSGNSALCFMPLDLDVPLEQQPSFHVLLHKGSDELVEVPAAAGHTAVGVGAAAAAGPGWAPATPAQHQQQEQQREEESSRQLLQQLQVVDEGAESSRQLLQQLQVVEGVEVGSGRQPQGGKGAAGHSTQHTPHTAQPADLPSSSCTSSQVAAEATPTDAAGGRAAGASGQGSSTAMGSSGVTTGDSRVTWSPRLQALQCWLEQHPGVVVVDPFQHTAKVLDRQQLDAMLCDLHQLQLPGGITARTPRSMVVTDWALCTSCGAAAAAGLAPPFIAKPLPACGVPSSHAMALAASWGALGALVGQLPLPALLQEFTNHGGVQAKVYVLGEQVFYSSRGSIPDVAAAAPAPGVPLEQQLLLFDSLASLPTTLPDGWRAADGGGGLTESPVSLPVLRSLAGYLRGKLQLTLFGFDVVVDSGSGQYVVVDVNYFPNYGGGGQQAQRWFRDALRQAFLAHGGAAVSGTCLS